MDRRSTKSAYIAKGGLFTALSVLCVYLSSILPVNKLYLLAIASFIIPLSVITTNIRNSILVYFSTCILSILVSGLKITTISYIVFFGLYGLIKYYIERIRKIHIEIFLKLIFLNTSLLIAFFCYKLFFPDILNVKAPLYLIIIGAQIVFFVYDYIATLFIGYINAKLTHL